MTPMVFGTEVDARPLAHRSFFPLAVPGASHRKSLAPGVTSPAFSQPSAAQSLLQRMLEAERSLALEGDQVTTVVRQGLDVSSEQHVWRNGSHTYRLDYLRPPRLSGETVVDNGQLLWHYQPSRNRLEIGPSRMRRLGARVPQVIKQVRQGTLTIQWRGQETVAGHVCGIVEVEPRGSAGARRRFWIDLANGAQLKIEHDNAQGQLRSVSYFTRIQYNPIFDRHAFDPPHTKRGVAVVPAESKSPPLTLEQVQAQARFPILQPAYLPPGFRFQSGTTTKFHKQPLVALRYANGLSILSVFETPDSSPDRNEKARQGIVVGWKNGLKIIVIGNVGADEMNRVLNSAR